ncbi:hypothetical protein PLCT2_00580 [Planctomycetaceae bacterium]|nr:hypothetical protein PLCT2_00580 [Planctomycetaceae bacterium]
MMNDPVVQILREAAARGRQLRLAREQAAQNETRSDSNVSEEQLSDPPINVAQTSQHGANAVEKESSK